MASVKVLSKVTVITTFPPTTLYIPTDYTVYSHLLQCIFPPTTLYIPTYFTVHSHLLHCTLPLTTLYIATYYTVHCHLLHCTFPPTSVYIAVEMRGGVIYFGIGNTAHKVSNTLVNDNAWHKISVSRNNLYIQVSSSRGRVARNTFSTIILYAIFLQHS